MTIYLDHAATTPLRDVARDAWLDASTAVNPASQYGSGRRARGQLDTARETIAELLGCEPIEVIFTASGTEADNIGVAGQFYARSAQHGNRVVSTPIEHPAVMDTVNALRGADVHYLPVSKSGVITDLTPLKEPAAVATCMWANNETGAIQPVEDVIAAARATHTPVHVDAVQVVGHRHVNFHELGATTLAASAHKFGGPRGVGILLAKRSPAPQGVIFGGGQERGIRSGTVDVAGAVSTAAALTEAVSEIDAEESRLRALRDQLRRAISSGVDDVVFHTPEGDQSLASHLYMSFPGAEGDSLIMLLDHKGIEASAGSACHMGVNRASEVLLAMGVDEKTARGTLRLTLGRTTTQEDIAAVAEALPEVVRLARLAGMA